VVASELNGLDSPDEAIFYTSGRTSVHPDLHGEARPGA